MSRDALGEIMKEYEDASGVGYRLPERSWNIVRLDGKAFHTYTKNLKKPYDVTLMGHMSGLLKFLCEKIDGAVFGYTQSDEISIVVTDLTSEKNQLWFGGNVQKITSVSAGYAAGYFNRLRNTTDLAVFDSRVFSLPSTEQVLNYLRWRQADCTRNALFLAASEYYSHSDLHGKGASKKISMLREAGSNWDLYPDSFKLGIQCKKVYSLETVEYARKDTGAIEQAEALRASWRLSPSPEYFNAKALQLHMGSLEILWGDYKCQESSS